MGRPLSMSEVLILLASLATHKRPNVYTIPGGMYAPMDPFRTDPPDSSHSRSWASHRNRLANSTSAFGGGSSTSAGVADRQHCYPTSPDPHFSSASPTNHRHAYNTASGKRSLKTQPESV